eukprot:763861-Hanusia_phi.AAC.2
MNSGKTSLLPFPLLSSLAFLLLLHARGFVVLVRFQGADVIEKARTRTAAFIRSGSTRPIIR